MPNTKRVLAEGCCYHLITRGNQKQDVFKYQEDYLMYLGLIRKLKRKHKFSLYAYCLMPNHVHLVGEFQNVSALPKFMHDLNRTYVLYFNGKYDKIGHLWQGRFKSKILLKDVYLINCLTYVEFNPLRANIVKDISKYPWTSYNSRVLGKENEILDQLPSI